MLKSIEIWNFESHEHTVVDGLSPGLNTLVGDSNVGKSSIIRALKLVAYNEFDPESVRVGCKNCRVKVVTDRGTVIVTRGPKDNLWEVTRNGCQTLYLDKVGTKVVPQASEIIGLGIVKLGDVDVPVNIMDQLESHFMLSGIGDEKATGSVRAQVIDEISGLSGIEGVIKSVSLDNTRHTREVSKLEAAAKEFRNKMHDERALRAEQFVVDEAGKLLAVVDENGEAVVLCSAVLSEWEAFCRTETSTVAAIAVLPDTKHALSIIHDVNEALHEAQVATGIAADFSATMMAIETKTDELSAIPDSKRAVAILGKSESASGKAKSAERLVASSKAMSAEENGIVGKLKLAARSASAAPFLSKVDAVTRRIRDARMLLRMATEDLRDVNEKEFSIAVTEKKLLAAIKDRDAVLASIKVCPISLGPVSPECLKGANG